MDEQSMVQLIEYLLKEKFNESRDIIKFTFFEVRVKYNLSEEDTNKLLLLTGNKLENLGYNVYYTGQEIRETGGIVPENELLYAVKKPEEKQSKKKN